MPVDPQLLEAQCGRTLARTDFPGLGTRIEGKVRDSYVQGSRAHAGRDGSHLRLRRVLGTIPWKGQVLNQLAAFWFERTRELAPNHVIAVPDPNVTIGRECRGVPLEFVVRGYLTGVTSTSIWTAYARGDRVYCGHVCPKACASTSGCRGRCSRPPPRRSTAPTTK